MKKHLDFVTKWANGEILTNTAPADRRALCHVMNDFNTLKSLCIDLIQNFGSRCNKKNCSSEGCIKTRRAEEILRRISE